MNEYRLVTVCIRARRTLCRCMFPRNADKRGLHDGKDINESYLVKLVVAAKCGLYERDLRRTTTWAGWEGLCRGRDDGSNKRPFP